MPHGIFVGPCSPVGVTIHAATSVAFDCLIQQLQRLPVEEQPALVRHVQLLPTTQDECWLVKALSVTQQGAVVREIRMRLEQHQVSLTDCCFLIIIK